MFFTFTLFGIQFYFIFIHLFILNYIFLLYNNPRTLCSQAKECK